MWVLGITTALCVHEKTHLPHSFVHIFQQTFSTTDPNFSGLNDDLAALRHFWFGKPVSGQCYSSLVFDNHPCLCPSISTYSQLLLNDRTHEHIFIFVSLVLYWWSIGGIKVEFISCYLSKIQWSASFWMFG